MQARGRVLLDDVRSEAASARSLSSGRAGGFGGLREIPLLAVFLEAHGLRSPPRLSGGGNSARSPISPGFRVTIIASPSSSALAMTSASLIEPSG